MKKLVSIVSVIMTIGIFLLSSCDKNKSCKTSLEAPVITNNSPVTAGDTVTLSIPRIKNGTYNWTGPFKFQSDSSSVKIIAYDTNLSGTFNVQYFTQDCLSYLSNADVVINPPSIPCTYAMNHAEVIGYRPSITFTDVAFYASDDSTHYSLQANVGSNGDYIYLNFVANMKPQNGAYTITSDFYPTFGEVHFSYGFNDDYWTVAEGKLYVTTTVGGKLTATWCDLACYRSWDGLAGTTSGNLTEQ